mmetsp:Transcript_51802/g.118011  ORF Transcript_51802/g.118011 Transcript_51802/m.118011 type:complete len:204 (+) Transcript_51802:601-1212(+)
MLARIFWSELLPSANEVESLSRFRTRSAARISPVMPRACCSTFWSCAVSSLSNVTMSLLRWSSLSTTRRESISSSRRSTSSTESTHAGGRTLCTLEGCPYCCPMGLVVMSRALRPSELRDAWPWALSDVRGISSSRPLLLSLLRDWDRCCDGRRAKLSSSRRAAKSLVRFRVAMMCGRRFKGKSLFGMSTAGRKSSPFASHKD